MNPPLRNSRSIPIAFGVAMLCGAPTDTAVAKPNKPDPTRRSTPVPRKKAPASPSASAKAEPRDDANIFYIHIPAYAFVPLTNARHWIRTLGYAYTTRSSSPTTLAAPLNFPVEPGRAYIRELRCSVRDTEWGHVEYAAGIGGIVHLTASSTGTSQAHPASEGAVAQPKQIIYLDTKDKGYSLTIKWSAKQDPTKRGWLPKALRFEGCRVEYYVEPASP